MKVTLKRVKRMIRKILNISGYLIVGLSAFFLILIFVSHHDGKVIFLGNRTIVWVMTDSMEETIPAESYIIIEKTTPSEIGTGDVIVYFSDDPTIYGYKNTHRVIDIIGENEEFVMKGDHNQAVDKYNAKPDRIIGKYVKNAPEKLSSIGRFLSTEMGIITSWTTVFALFVAICFPGIKSAISRSEENQIKKKQEMIDRLVKEEVEKLKKKETGSEALPEDGNDPAKQEGGNDEHSGK